MIGELVMFALPEGLSRDEVIEGMREVAPKWRLERDLVRKTFLHDAQAGQAGALYTWTDRAAAQRAHDARWRAGIRARYGSEPSVRYFETPLIVDNALGAVVEAEALRVQARSPMLDPQARALLELIERSGLPPIHALSPGEARRVYRERRAYSQPDAPAVSLCTDLQAAGPAGPIPLRLIRPLGAAADAMLPVLVYFHGGGWVIGDLDTHETLCRELANGAGCAVVSVDYRMGPEHRFPAAVEDSVAAVLWVSRNAAALKLDATRLAVGGDSAGGNLASVAAIEARDEGNPAIAFQLLIYPATDMRRCTASHRTNGKGYLLERVTIDYFHDHYIEDPTLDLDWRASPLLHEDLAGLPPALVLTAGHDPLRDEGLQYSARLAQAGNEVSHICFERQIHGFITMGRVIGEANTAVAFCASALRRALRC